MVRTKQEAVTGVRQSTYHGNVHTHQQSFKEIPAPVTAEEDEHARPDRTMLLHHWIRSEFPDILYEEVDIMLMDCGNDERELCRRLATRPDYLQGIRRIVASTPARVAVSQPPAAEVTAVAPATVSPLLPPPSSSSPAATVVTNEQHGVAQPSRRPAHHQPSSKAISSPKKKKDGKKRTAGRLALDDALKQIQTEHKYEGWSDARVRAFQMIDENPNSYYYRFNAPGEEQRKGPWTDEERRLFFERLKQVGPNGQWGLFSVAIPGRVGYQCSNYYRLLIESGQLHDPNYVLDGKGKAHFLFDKKSSDGRIEKTFRTHSPHTFGKKTSSSTTIQKRQKHPQHHHHHAPKKNSNKQEQHDNDMSGSFSMNLRSSSRMGAAASARIARSKQQQPIVSS